MKNTEFLYTGTDVNNWFYERYHLKYAGSNSRYYTFQLALNLLNQKKKKKPLIVETGCQRQEEDVGAGMSTSIFAEYISRYGGELITCDLYSMHLDRAREYVTKWPDAEVKFVEQDSVTFLSGLGNSPDLLYLDSLDYPIEQTEVFEGLKNAAQEHCFREFKASEALLKKKSLLLLDDNQLPGGGKPKLVKEYLLDHKDWTLLLDLQSSLWMKM